MRCKGRRAGRAIGPPGGTEVVVQRHKWGAVSVLERDEGRQGNHWGRAVLCDAGGESSEEDRCRGTGPLDLGAGEHRRGSPEVRRRLGMGETGVTVEMDLAMVHREYSDSLRFR